MKEDDSAPVCGATVSAYKKIKLLVTIVERGKGERVVELCRKNGSAYQLSFLGRGTADSELLDYLGLGETEKDIVLSVVLEERLCEVMETLKQRLALGEAGGGIAFTIPIASVGGPMTFGVLSGMPELLEEHLKKRGETSGS